MDDRKLYKYVDQVSFTLLTALPVLFSSVFLSASDALLIVKLAATLSLFLMLSHGMVTVPYFLATSHVDNVESCRNIVLFGLLIALIGAVVLAAKLKIIDAFLASYQCVALYLFVTLLDVSRRAKYKYGMDIWAMMMSLSSACSLSIFIIIGFINNVTDLVSSIVMSALLGLAVGLCSSRAVTLGRVCFTSITLYFSRGAMNTSSILLFWFGTNAIFLFFSDRLAPDVVVVSRITMMVMGFSSVYFSAKENQLQPLLTTMVSQRQDAEVSLAESSYLKQSNRVMLAVTSIAIPLFLSFVELNAINVAIFVIVILSQTVIAKSRFDFWLLKSYVKLRFILMSNAFAVFLSLLCFAILSKFTDLAIALAFFTLVVVQALMGKLGRKKLGL